MNLKPFDAAKYFRVRDLPWLWWDALRENSLAYWRVTMKTSWRVILAALGLITLAGCTTAKVVTQPCPAPDTELPQEPPKIQHLLTGNAERDVQIIAGSAVRLRAWGKSLEGIVKACQG